MFLAWTTSDRSGERKAGGTTFVCFPRNWAANTACTLCYIALYEWAVDREILGEEQTWTRETDTKRYAIHEKTWHNCKTLHLVSEKRIWWARILQVEQIKGRISKRLIYWEYFTCSPTLTLTDGENLQLYFLKRSLALPLFPFHCHWIEPVEH